ncbi:restriction endonuclease [Streptomyces sp. B1866]|uniref:restriction endonuclease n=1 Tax=Streptomyces sp. B1866 TaxID=3075431 RepID=UPI00288D6A0D|nr:restriction endonuclease [Streptomyces sp. B1866]MDT3396409.1 restriction endonuclease [Streptomyces sp. B1866]
MQEPLTLDTLKDAARSFADEQNDLGVPELYGVNDGKTVGTYAESAFNRFIALNYRHQPGNAAKGIDFPGLNVDLKFTSIKQPQSSCPFRSARQKVYGLGYHILLMVYEKFDDHDLRTALLEFRHVLFIEDRRTADYHLTAGIRRLVRQGAIVDEVDAYLEDRNLPLDPESRWELAARLIDDPPEQGVLTVSNALQWRLQYGRAIRSADAPEEFPGLEDLLA